MVLIKKGRCHFILTTARFHPQEVLKLLDYRIIRTLFRSKRFICLMKWTLQNASEFVILYLYKYPNWLFPFFILCVTLLIFCRHLSEKYVKYRRKWNGKRKLGCLCTWNMANFEAFWWNKKLSANLLFLKSDVATILLVNK